VPTSAPDSFTTDTASRSLPGGALKSRRMPFPDSPVAVDALRSSEARAHSACMTGCESTRAANGIVVTFPGSLL